MIAIIDSGFSFTKLIIINGYIVIASLITGSSDILDVLYRSYNVDYTILLGINASNIKTKLNISDETSIRVNEINCNGYLSEHFDIKPAIIVSFGSGVNFTRYDEKGAEFITGSGFGTCALEEIYKLIFPKQSFSALLSMANNGHNHNTSIEMKEINTELSGWLREESNAVNFGRHSDDCSDILLGILRGFLDQINTVIRSILFYEKISNIVITGSLFKNIKVKEIIQYNLFDLNYAIPEYPEFGACIGAYYFYTMKINGMDKIMLKWKD